MMHDDKSKPTHGRPMDDNIDDLGRKPDGTTLDQPGSAKVEKPADKQDIEPGSDADSDDKSLGVWTQQKTPAASCIVELGEPALTSSNESSTPNGTVVGAASLLVVAVGITSPLLLEKATRRSSDLRQYLLTRRGSLRDDPYQRRSEGSGTSLHPSWGGPQFGMLEDMPPFLYQDMFQNWPRRTQKCPTIRMERPQNYIVESEHP
jgi:hypothetical protein